MTDQISVWLSWCWPAVPMWQVAEDISLEPDAWVKSQLAVIDHSLWRPLASTGLILHLQSGGNTVCLRWVLVRIQWVKVAVLE